jgi:Domain of unknown function (DUF4234)
LSTPEDNNETTAPAPAPSTEASAGALAPSTETSAAAANTGPLGKERGIGFVIVLTLVTLGFYGLYWFYKSYSEVKHHRGEGVGGVVGLLLCFIIVGYFKLPQYVGRMYRAEGNENPPVSGLTGLWGFVPYVGLFIYLAKVQGSLNAYWKAKGAGSVAAVPASSTSF